MPDCATSGHRYNRNEPPLAQDQTLHWHPFCFFISSELSSPVMVKSV
jgi:hypothetical protein